jgi:hypothetical protein
LRQLHKIECESSGRGPTRKQSLQNSLRAGNCALYRRMSLFHTLFRGG